MLPGRMLRAYTRIVLVGLEPGRRMATGLPQFLDCRPFGSSFMRRLAGKSNCANEMREMGPYQVEEQP